MKKKHLYPPLLTRIYPFSVLLTPPKVLNLGADVGTSLANTWNKVACSDQGWKKVGWAMAHTINFSRFAGLFPLNSPPTSATRSQPCSTRSDTLPLGQHHDPGRFVGSVRRWRGKYLQKIGRNGHFSDFLHAKIRITFLCIINFSRDLHHLLAQPAARRAARFGVVAFESGEMRSKIPTRFGSDGVGKVRTLPTPTPPNFWDPETAGHFHLVSFHASPRVLDRR